MNARGDKKHADRKLRKKIDAFKHHLRHLELPITINDTWESVRSRALGHDYDALDEVQRVYAFDKVIRRLHVFTI